MAYLDLRLGMNNTTNLHLLFVIVYRATEGSDIHFTAATLVFVLSLMGVKCDGQRNREALYSPFVSFTVSSRIAIYYSYFDIIDSEAFVLVNHLVAKT